MYMTLSCTCIPKGKTGDGISVHHCTAISLRTAAAPGQAGYSTTVGKGCVCVAKDVA